MKRSDVYDAVLAVCSGAVAVLFGLAAALAPSGTHLALACVWSLVTGMYLGRLAKS